MTDIETLQRQLETLKQPQRDIEALEAQIEQQQRIEAQEKYDGDQVRASTLLHRSMVQNRQRLTELSALRSAIVDQVSLIVRAIDEYSRASQQLNEGFYSVVLQAVSDHRAYNAVVYDDPEQVSYAEQAIESLFNGSYPDLSVPVPDVLTNRVSVPVSQVPDNMIELSQQISQSLFYENTVLPVSSVVVE